MSAILGILGDADISEVRRLNERLTHRGSEHGEWSFSSRIHFGQRVIPGHPGTVTPGRPLVYDGALQNREEIANLLGLSAKAAAVQAEETLILELYAKFGRDCFQYLRGPFAVAIWDGDNETLLLACDFFKSRPLYYIKTQERFLFASEYKALLLANDVLARPNLDVLQYINCTKEAHRERCCLDDVRSVPPGHWLAVRNMEIETQRYWAPQLEIPRLSDAEHMQRFREAFMEAIRQHIAPYKRVGVALSGGIDSASIVAGIRHIAPERELHTFVAGFGPDDPEVQGAAETARYFKTNHHEIMLHASELPSLLPQLCWHLEEPIGRENNPYLYVCAREASPYVDILCGGHALDMLLGGMPRHLVAHLAHRFPLATGPLMDLLRYARTGGQPRTLLGRAMLRWYFDGGIYLPPRVMGAGPLPEPQSLKVEGPNPLSEFLRQAILEDSGKAYYDNEHSTFGVAFGAPLAVSSFVAAVFQLPDDLKIRGLTQKYILRQSLADLLPPSIATRRKSLARLSHDTALADAIGGMADRLLAPRQVRERGIFEPEYAQKVVRRKAGKPYPKEQFYRLWTMVMIELWCRIFLDGHGALPDANILD